MNSVERECESELWAICVKITSRDRWSVLEALTMVERKKNCWESITLPLIDYRIIYFDQFPRRRREDTCSLHIVGWHQIDGPGNSFSKKCCSCLHYLCITHPVDVKTLWHKPLIDHGLLFTHLRMAPDFSVGSYCQCHHCIALSSSLYVVGPPKGAFSLCRTFKWLLSIEIFFIGWAIVLLTLFVNKLLPVPLVQHCIAFSI